MPDAKPGDFFLGAVEFFAILLPGAVFVYLVQPWARQLIPANLLPTDNVEAWAVFVVSAYVVGHLLHAITGKLDFIYDDFYLSRFQPHHYAAIQLIKKKDVQSLEQDAKLASTLVARAYSRAHGMSAGTRLYDWCLSFARLKNPAAAAEVDRNQADSKFFRSVTLVLLTAAIVTASQGFMMAAAVSLVLVFFSAWRFCELRWNATKRVYEYYLLIHYYPDPSGVTPRGAA